MTVEELIEELDQFGGHLPVRLVSRGKFADHVFEISVSDEYFNDELIIVLDRAER